MQRLRKLFVLVSSRTGLARFSTHLSLDDNVTLSCESRGVEMVIVEVEKCGFVLLIVRVGADKLAVELRSIDIDTAGRRRCDFTTLSEVEIWRCQFCLRRWQGHKSED
jgi:hypothetical protein